ncbi:MAG TPA: TIGR03435 family protein [Vicinamibacterales bacterium]|jgi:uncharacterized protein (TIGR03435 family)|nr:TIGR03435 family protein [Vicinamibacterales bacterium]
MKVFVASLGVLAVSLGLAAQSPAPSSDGPSFEAATIRLNNSGARGGRGTGGAGGRYVLTNSTAMGLVLNGYSVRPQQVMSAPSWMNTEHYDINAIGPATAPLEQRRSMWRRLLEERFGLKVHHEQRAMNVANLMLARRDGTLGPRLTRASDVDSDCEAGRAAFSSGQFDFSKGPPPCSTSVSTTPAGTQLLSMRGRSIDEIGDNFSGNGTGFVFVFNKTGLDGAFNVEHFEFRPAASARTTNDVAPVDVPEVFTAMQEQLGLKLEPVKEPVDVLVIDSIEHPHFD